MNTGVVPLSPDRDFELEVDERLLSRIAAGDRAAVAELYDRHAARLLALGARILRDSREAEDVLHDVFVEAWQKAKDYDRSRGTVQAWLCLRMRSRSLDRLRSAGRSRTVLSEEVVRASTAMHTELDMSEAPDRRAAREALMALPEEQRVVLELAYFQGLSSSEIAEALAVPMGTVKSRTAAGLRKLRALFVPKAEVDDV